MAEVSTREARTSIVRSVERMVQRPIKEAAREAMEESWREAQRNRRRSLASCTILPLFIGAVVGYLFGRRGIDRRPRWVAFDSPSLRRDVQGEPDSDSVVETDGGSRGRDLRKLLVLGALVTIGYALKARYLTHGERTVAVWTGTAADEVGHRADVVAGRPVDAANEDPGRFKEGGEEAVETPDDVDEWVPSETTDAQNRDDEDGR